MENSDTNKLGIQLNQCNYMCKAEQSTHYRNEVHGYSEPYRLDRNGNGSGILVFICEDIPTKLIDFQMKIEVFFIELYLEEKSGFCAVLITLNILKYHII